MLYFTAETLYWASPLIACCCLGVVTVMTLKPDCASRNSFFEATSSASFVATVWQADISANAALAIAMVVSVDIFFTLSLYDLPTNPPRPRSPLAQTHHTAELRCF